MLEALIIPRTRDLGDGFLVRRALPAGARRMVGPFIFFDQMGPVELDPGRGLDVRPHPHIGLATLTYLFDGEIVHRDSLGTVQEIRPGDVNWMTAGRGIVHSERTPQALRAKGVRLSGIQTWVGLPRRDEDAPPFFAHHPAGALPVIEQPGAQLRLVAGTLYGERSPVRAFSQMFYADAMLEPGARLLLSAEHEERAAYVVDGTLEMTGEGRGFGPGELLVLRPEASVELRASASGPLRMMLLGGAALDGPRYIWWNFVASSKARIEQAAADWEAERFPGVPGDPERIPLPKRRRDARVDYP
jgi:redox-sensitive bicupin YhaK (pirin superfamily)